LRKKRSVVTYFPGSKYYCKNGETRNRLRLSYLFVLQRAIRNNFDIKISISKIVKQISPDFTIETFPFVTLEDEKFFEKVAETFEVCITVFIFLDLKKPIVHKIYNFEEGEKMIFILFMGEEHGWGLIENLKKFLKNSNPLKNVWIFQTRDNFNRILKVSKNNSNLFKINLFLKNTHILETKTSRGVFAIVKF